MNEKSYFDLLSSSPSNENFPSFNFFSGLMASLSKSDGVGTVIMTVRAEAGNQPVSLELWSWNNDYFALDPTSGQLSIAKPLDKKDRAASDDIIILTVRASLEGQSGKLTAENDEKCLFKCKTDT